MGWKYFTLDEFKCKCCGQSIMNYEFIDQLDLAREESDMPFDIRSGYRCLKHNRAVKSSDTSSHRFGLAADIVVKSSAARFRIVNALIKLGFNRIGIGNDFIHVDIDKNKVSNVIWHYY